MDLEQIRAWVVGTVLRMVTYQELLFDRDAKDLALAQIDEDLQQLLAQQARLQVQLEREEAVHTQLAEVSNKVDNLDNQSEFINTQLGDIIRQLAAIKPEPIDSTLMECIQSLEGARACISIFFTLLIESKLEQNQTTRDLEFQVHEQAGLRRQLEQLRKLGEVKEMLHAQSVAEIHQQ